MSKLDLEAIRKRLEDAIQYFCRDYHGRRIDRADGLTMVLDEDLPALLEENKELRAEVERLEGELEDLRVLAQVRGAGCQCGDDEACAFLRRSQQAEAKLAELEQVHGYAHDMERALSATEQERDEAYACIEYGRDAIQAYCDSENEMRQERDRLQWIRGNLHKKIRALEKKVAQSLKGGE